VPGAPAPLPCFDPCQPIGLLLRSCRPLPLSAAILVCSPVCHGPPCIGACSLGLANMQGSKATALVASADGKGHPEEPQGAGTLSGGEGASSRAAGACPALTSAGTAPGSGETQSGAAPGEQDPHPEHFVAPPRDGGSVAQVRARRAPVRCSHTGPEHWGTQRPRRAMQNMVCTVCSGQTDLPAPWRVLRGVPAVQPAACAGWALHRHASQCVYLCGSHSCARHPPSRARQPASAAPQPRPSPLAAQVPGSLVVTESSRRPPECGVNTSGPDRARADAVAAAFFTSRQARP